MISFASHLTKIFVAKLVKFFIKQKNHKSMTHEEIKSITSLIDARIAKIKELDLDNMDMQKHILVLAVLIAYLTCKGEILEYYINRVKEQGYIS